MGTRNWEGTRPRNESSSSSKRAVGDKDERGDEEGGTMVEDEEG